jgi:hypothetical protein
MAKIILNSCFGGYGWSALGIVKYLAAGGAQDIHITRDDYCTEVKAVLNGEPVEYHQYSIGREDPIAISTLERWGSKLCSGSHAELKIAEYDEDLFIANIDDYDGFESLDLIPRLTESRIRACKDVDEIVDLLRKMNVFTAAE